jgi:hypothetical protein
MKLTEEKEREIISKVKDMREAAVMGNTDLFDRMEEGKRFTYRDQWDPAVKAWNDKKGKFSLQIPLIKPKIKQIVGMQLQHPKDLKVEANRGGSETGSNILTKTGKHASDENNIIFQKTHWFEAGLAAGISFIGVFVDRNEDPKHGNLKIMKLNEDECAIDPDCNVYDPNDFYQGAKYMIWEPWVDKDLAEKLYPDKADEIGNSGYETLANDTTGFWSRLWGGFRSAINTLSGDRVLHTEKLYENKYHLTHCFWRQAKECFMLYDSQKSELDAMLLKKDDEIKLAKKLAKKYAEQYSDPDRFSFERVVRQVMCHTTMCGDILLEHIEDELNGVDMFNLVPFSPYFDNGWRSGMTEDLIGTQEEINYSHSQKLNILKKLPNSGWIIKGDPTGTGKQFLEEHGAEDNVILDLSLFGGQIEKITETKYPSGWERNEEISIRNLHLISGVRSEDSSYDDSNLSGRALGLKQQASATGNSPILQNFDYSQTILNKLIIEIIRVNDIYSLDEILEIVDAEEMIDKRLLDDARNQVIKELEARGFRLADQPPQLDLEAAGLDKSYIQNYLADIELIKKQNELIDKLARPIAMDMLKAEIGNLKKGKYNTTVTMSPYSPTMRMAEMAERLEINDILIKGGQPPLPARRLIEASSMTDKEDIIREMEAGQQAMQLARAAG